MIHKGYMSFVKKQKEVKVLVIDISEIDFIKDADDYMRLKEIIMNTQVSFME